MTRALLFGLLAASLTVGCLDPGTPKGLRAAVDGTGPMVTWDLDAKPLPEIPFPSDIATRLDPDSPTGRRVNISTEAPTKFERKLRRRASQLTGFGTFSEITVGFEAPLDLCAIARAHHRYENGDINDDLGDDAVLVINVTPGGEHYGEVALLDVGHGFFPNLLEKQKYFDGDPGTGSNLMLKDEPFPPAACPNGFQYDRNTFYEHETNTLIIRPVTPLEEMNTYAVVLTRHLVGLNGEPVRSPFEWIHHLRQTSALDQGKLEAVLPNGMDLDDIAFVWTFSTADTSSELLDIRRGLYGHGPFAALEERFPVNETTLVLDDLFDDETALPGNPFVLPFSQLGDTLKPYLEELIGADADAQPLLDTYVYVDYLVSGTIVGPNFLIDRDGINTEDKGCLPWRPGADADVWDCRPGIKGGDDNEIFELDQRTGAMVVGETKISFWCAIPNDDRKVDRSKPFPVAFYGHGYTSGRLEMLGFAGNHARHGIATCAIDAFGHGVVISPNDLPPRLVRAAFASGGIGVTVDAVIPGRARDLNADGIPDAGGDFWTADVFHTRDIVRQSVIDQMTLLRALRHFDGVTLGADMNGDGEPELFGDFDADGEVDIGGPDVRYHAWGQSMGGFISGIQAGVDPHLSAAAPTAGAAGLFDVGIRSRQGGVVEAVWLPLMGPIFVGQTDAGILRVTAIVSDFNKDAKLPLADVEFTAEGDEVQVWNLINGEVGITTIDANGVFRTSVAADGINASVKRRAMGFDVFHPEHEFFLTTRPPTIHDTLQLPSLDMPDEPFGDCLQIHICEGPCELLPDADPLPDPALGCDQRGRSPFSNLRKLIETFELGPDEGVDESGKVTFGVLFQGTVYEQGTALIATSGGFGYERQTPDLRRLRAIAGFIAEPGDPATYMKYFSRRKDDLKERWNGAEAGVEFGTAVNIIVTVGDMNVPVNGGVMMAWAAGFMELDELRLLRDNYVLEAVERVRATHWLCPFPAPGQPPRPCDPAAAVLYDADNLSNGTDGFEVDGKPAPRPPTGEELRVTYVDPDPNVNRVHGLRLPAIKPQGDHGFLIPNPTLPFDVHSFMAHQISHYFATGGAELSDDPCLARPDTCPPELVPP